MSTYATRTDVENYIEGWVTSDPIALDNLIKRSERDIDRLLPRGTLTDAVIGISMSGVTGGSVTLGLKWLGTDYTSMPIGWNYTGMDVISSLQAMTDDQGFPVPPGVWSVPQSRYYQQPWAFGPLPDHPVVVEAVNSLGGQTLEDLTVVSNNLIGVNPPSIVQTIISGGLRANPYQLPASYSRALRDATCAQVEYRVTMGEDFFIRAQHASVSGPEFRTQGRLPIIGPKVARELQGTDLLQRGARARPGSVTGVPLRYAPTGNTPIPDDWRSI